MKTARLMAATLAAFMLCGAAYADGADPKTVTPAWVIEKEIEQQQSQAQEEPKLTTETATSNAFSLFFIGYEYPTFSGPLASYLTAWDSPINLSFGIEASNSTSSSFLSGLELEFFITINDQGTRILANDMVMLGYSIALADIARFNLGARLGLSLLDVTDYNSANPSYMLLGGIAGPEASIYGMVAKDFWLWVRGRYTMGYYFTVDSSGDGVNPIDAGDRTLNCLSFEAGLAFRM